MSWPLKSPSFRHGTAWSAGTSATPHLGPGGAHQALSHPQLRLDGAHCHRTWPQGRAFLFTGDCGRAVRKAPCSTSSS